jgi:protein MpaA
MAEALDWPDFLAAFTRSAEKAGFSRVPIHETSAGPLLAWTRGGSRAKVYLSAGMHGDEPAGPLAMLRLMDEGFFHPGIQWILCPALNPTGLAQGTRENAEGIDLNRDYWLKRSGEARAHAAWLEKQALPDLFLSLHEDWETSGFYFYEINLGRDTPQRAAGIIEAVKPWFPPESGGEIDGHIPRAPGWIYHEAEADLPEGWPEAIFIAKLGCPLSFTFETPSHAPLEKRIAAHCAAVGSACAWI